MQFWIFNFPQIQTIRTSNVHNFPLDLHNSSYSNFLQIQTSHTSIVRNFSLHLRNSGYSILCKSRQSVHMMYFISCRINAILDIQFFCKSTQSIDIMYTISREIYAILDIQFSANPDNPYI